MLCLETLTIDKFNVPSLKKKLGFIMTIVVMMKLVLFARRLGLCVLEVMYYEVNLNILQICEEERIFNILIAPHCIVFPYDQSMTLRSSHVHNGMFKFTFGLPQ